MDGFYIKFNPPLAMSMFVCLDVVRLPNIVLKDVYFIVNCSGLIMFELGRSENDFENEIYLRILSMMFCYVLKSFL